MLKQIIAIGHPLISNLNSEGVPGSTCEKWDKGCISTNVVRILVRTAWLYC